MSTIVLDRPADRVPVVCPGCHRGRLRIQTRYVPGRLVNDLAEVPSWIRCTRVAACGWWKPLVADPAQGPIGPPPLSTTGPAPPAPPQPAWLGDFRPMVPCATCGCGRTRHHGTSCRGPYCRPPYTQGDRPPCDGYVPSLLTETYLLRRRRVHELRANHKRLLRPVEVPPIATKRLVRPGRRSPQSDKDDERELLEIMHGGVPKK